MRAIRHARAGAFDAEKGIPEEACREVARAILEAAGAASGAAVEIGAGTGRIGRFLADERPYAGLDSSRSMLSAFARRTPRGRLVEADAAGRWPLRAGSAALVFGARVFHLLDADHVAREAARVLARGGVFLSGRVGRESGGAREILRRSLIEALARRGLGGRDVREVASDVLDVLRSHGASRLAPTVVTRWTTTRRPAASLETWRAREGLPGHPSVGSVVKAEILAEVEAQGRAAFGDLEAPVHSDEWFELEGARVP
jgi:SAM-dependent methyltransferase